MTVETTESKTQYVADGISRNYSFSFKTFDPVTIKVYFDSIEIFSGFTVSLNVDQDNNPGGSVIFSAEEDPPAAGITISILREEDYVQLTDYQEYDPFPALTHERALDKLTFICQQLLEIIERSPVPPPDSSPGDAFVPGNLTVQDNLVVGGDSQLQGVTATQVSLSDAAATPQEAVRKNELDEEIDTLNNKLADISLLTVPIGTILPFSSTNIPVGYLLCDGAAIDPQYTTLIGLVGANTPDLRGQFLRGWSQDSNVDPDGPRGALDGPQADEFRSHNHPNGADTAAGTISSGATIGQLSVNTGNRGGAETRPVNVTVVFIIKT